MAIPLLMLEMLPLRPDTVLLRLDTDDCTDEMLAVIVPIEVLSVAVLPFIAVTTALMAVRLAWIVPSVVWIVATVPLMLVMFAPSARTLVLTVLTVVFRALRVAWFVLTVLFVWVTVLLIAFSNELELSA